MRTPVAGSGSCVRAVGVGYDRARVVARRTPRQPRRPLGASQGVSNAFARYDRDNSNFLDAKGSYGRASSDYGVDVEREESRRYLAAYDDTPDGRLDLQEFAALVKDLESPLFQATHGGGASSRDDYRDDRSSHETAGSDKMASVPEHGQSRASQFLAQSGTASARSTRGSFSDRNNPPPSVRPQSSYSS